MANENVKIAVIGANGREGQLIVKEAIARGFDVTAVVRGENRSEAPRALVKDALDLTTDDLKGFDVVADAVGGWTADTVSIVPQVEKHLVDILTGTRTRLVIVGGAGSLYVNPEHTATVADGPDFPDAFKPVAAAHAQALDDLRSRDDLNWTYISPAGDFQADGERTGKYLLGGEELTLNSRGESIISYADYAIAFVDEIEKGDHSRERISVVRA